MEVKWRRRPLAVFLVIAFCIGIGVGTDFPARALAMAGTPDQPPKIISTAVSAQQEATGEHKVLVVGGTADNQTAKAGEQVTVVANNPVSGQEFEMWWSNSGVAFEEAESQTTTFLMPDHPVMITAFYRKLPLPLTFPIQVSGGDANRTTAPEGELVAITASTPPSGKRFKIWETDGIDLDSAVNPTATFTMPARGVSFVATYLENVSLLNSGSYDISVVRGKADKTSAAPGETVTITADSPGSGEKFRLWTSGDSLSFRSASSATTTFTMPAWPVKITATYVSTDQEYSVTVVSGSADKTTAKKGETVRITASSATSGKRFKEWTSRSGVTFGRATSSTTTFTMPGKDVTVTAVYERASSSSSESSSSSSSGRDEDTDDSSSDEYDEPSGDSQTKTIEKAAVETLVAKAKEITGRSYVRTSGAGKTTVKKDALAAAKGYRYEHDTIQGKKVQVRVVITYPENAVEDLAVSGYIQGSSVRRTNAVCKKFFKNKVAVVSLDQKTAWGQTVIVAAKLDLSGMDTKNIVVYSYDAAKNQCQLMEAKYEVDSKGYLHFTTTLGGDIIISEGKLELLK